MWHVDGDLVAFDTDMIGPFGFCADISRTWICGDARPDDEQRRLYEAAYTEVHENLRMVRAGAAFSELTTRGYKQSAEFIQNRYPCLAHGVGMSDEYPVIFYREDFPTNGYDGELQANSVLCIESYVGADAGRNGVKLEQQVLVTETGYELLSEYPLELDWL